MEYFTWKVGPWDARVVTDQATFAWICDVLVDASHRGEGVVTRMVGAVVEHWRGLGVPRLLLAARDAHQVYEKIGFSHLANSDRFMEVDLRTKF
jgi:GNAT superfamily N-acetyltransferase